MEALSKYESALKCLNPEEDDKETERWSPEVVQAIKLLRQDLRERVRDIEALIDLQRPSTAKSSAISTSVLLSANPSSPNMSSIRGGSHAIGIQPDPLLVKIMNKLQIDLVAKIDENNDKKSQKTEAIINQHLIQFMKDLSLYEQKKYKEFNARLEKANNENKKLSNQIVKLRERWDSLVESAKQRRTRQQENLNEVNSQ